MGAHFGIAVGGRSETVEVRFGIGMEVRSGIEEAPFGTAEENPGRQAAGIAAAEHMIDY